MIRVRYFEPTFGMREFDCATPADLAYAVTWLDAGGYMYSTRELAR